MLYTLQTVYHNLSSLLWFTSSVQLTVHKSVSDQTVTNSYSWQLLFCSFRHSTITCNLKYEYRKACVRFLLVTYICVISGGHQELLGAITPSCVYSLEIVHTAMEIKPVFWTLIVSTKRASLNLVLLQVPRPTGSQVQNVVYSSAIVWDKTALL